MFTECDYSTSIALHWCWINLRALIFCNFPIYSLSLQLGRFFSFYSYFPSSKNELTKKKKTHFILFFYYQRRCSRSQGVTWECPGPQVDGWPSQPSVNSPCHPHINESFRCLLGCLGSLLWLWGNLWNLKKKSWLQAYIISGPQGRMFVCVGRLLIHALCQPFPLRGGRWEF